MESYLVSMKITKLEFIPLSLLLICWCSLCSQAHSVTRSVRQVTCQDKFQCGDGTCLDKLDLCNGLAQCRDESDESPSTCDCGVRKTEDGSSVRGSGNTEGVSDALQRSHPWHVDIYRVSNKYHRLLCTGSLIYDNIVLTAGSCVYDEESSLPYEPSSILISAGTIAREFKLDKTSHQNLTVSKIMIMDEYEGKSNGFVGNLAIIKLIGPIKRTDYVKPICLWEEAQLPEGDKLTTVSGWGSQTLVNDTMNLTEARIVLLERNNISTDPLNKIFVSDDKVCLNFDQGIEVKDIDTGGAVEVYSQERHYLVGILSPNRTGNAYGLATEVWKYIPWIRNTTYLLKQYERGCHVPEGYKFSRLIKCDISEECADAERASHGSVYRVSCLGNRTFARTNQEDVQIKCADGEWTPNLDEYKCLDLCPELEYKTLNLQCYHSRNKVPCNQRLLPDTAVYASCKRNHEVNTITNFVNRTTCLQNGSYDHELSECTPVCGKTATSNAQTLISNGTRVNYPKYPWHIALYWKHNKYNGTFDYEYKCGGTLIDRNKVLTAAHCIWEPVSGKLKEANILEVASGKIYSRWNAEDASVQKVGVANVIPASSFKGFTTRYEQDIAVLILSEDLELSDFTMPACLDLDLSAGGMPAGQCGHVVGWGREDEKDTSPSEYLMETWMEYLDVDSCHKKFRKHSFQEYLLSDKFCVLYVNGSGTQQGDSGGGLTFLHDGLHYVYGVVSIKKLGQNEFAAVTNVTSHRHWLQDILATNGLSSGCSIPQGGEIFHLVKCGDSRGCDNKDLAPLNSAYYVTCADGYGFSIPNQTFAEIFCFKGKWIPNESQWGCLALCPGVMQNKSVTLGCTYRGVPVPCDQPLRPDTMVSVSCKAHYKLPYASKADFISETKCEVDGTLQQELKMCVPDCGRISYVLPLRANDHDNKVPLYSWHILIYRREQNPAGKHYYQYQCAGTLVDSNKVITAAHCVWDEAKHGPMSADLMTVASGKGQYIWDFLDLYEQKVRVSKVIPSLHYRGNSGNITGDIAVLILSNDLQFSAYTMPLCLDLDLLAGGVPQGELGQVVIWDRPIGEPVQPNTTLTDILVEYLDVKSCRTKFKESRFEKYLVVDKFCILYNNGTGPQAYDSGAGVIFKHYNLYYLYGVVSVKKKGEYLFAAVTNVTSHSSWLTDVLATN